MFLFFHLRSNTPLLFFVISIQVIRSGIYDDQTIWLLFTFWWAFHYHHHQLHSNSLVKSGTAGFWWLGHSHRLSSIMYRSLLHKDNHWSKTFLRTRSLQWYTSRRKTYYWCLILLLFFFIYIFNYMHIFLFTYNDETYFPYIWKCKIWHLITFFPHLLFLFTLFYFLRI